MERQTNALEGIAHLFGVDLVNAVDDYGDALDALPDTIPVPRGIPGGESGTPLGYVPMADGGIGRVTKPTLFLAGEAGPEDVAFSGANRSFSGGGGTTVIFEKGAFQSLDPKGSEELVLAAFASGMVARGPVAMRAVSALDGASRVARR